MASHTGMVNVLRTKKGYIDCNGNITNDIEKAKKIYAYELGFVDAKEAYFRLGFTNKEVIKNGIEYFQIELSYDSRLSEIEKLFCGNWYGLSKCLR